MKRKRHTEEQIISILKEHEAGASGPELSRRQAVAENTIYRWKSKFGGMEVSEVKRLRELEQENAKLKKLLAEAELDKAALKAVRQWKYEPTVLNGQPVPVIMDVRVSFRLS